MTEELILLQTQHLKSVSFKDYLIELDIKHELVQRSFSTGNCILVTHNDFNLLRLAGHFIYQKTYIGFFKGSEAVWYGVYQHQIV